MINKCANVCFNAVLGNKEMEKDEKEVYIYGFEIILSTVSSFLFMFLFSLLIGRPLYALIFFAIFYVLRLYCGGFHAKTYFKCFVATNSLFILLVVLTQVVSLFNIDFILPYLLLISYLVIIMFSPIKNINHPCSKKTMNKNKIKAILIASVYFTVLVVMYFLKIRGVYFVHSALSFILVSIMMLPAICKGGVKSV